jgi:hypothetical protein
VKDLPPPQPDFQVFEFDDWSGVHSINGAWCWAASP